MTDMLDDPNEVELLHVDWGDPIRASVSMASVPGVVIHVQLNEHWWVTEVRIEATDGHIGAKELRALALQKIVRAIARQHHQDCGELPIVAEP